MSLWRYLMITLHWMNFSRALMVAITLTGTWWNLTAIQVPVSYSCMQNGKFNLWYGTVGKLNCGMIIVPKSVFMLNYDSVMWSLSKSRFSDVQTWKVTCTSSRWYAEKNADFMFCSIVICLVGFPMYCVKKFMHRRWCNRHRICKRLFSYKTRRLWFYFKFQLTQPL